MDLDEHVGAELACLHVADAGIAQCADKGFDQRCGLFGTGRGDKVGTAAAAGVGVQRELRNDQRAAMHV